MINPILLELKENDIVMMEVMKVKEICRIFNFKNADSDKWLEFDGEILYTNTKLHKSMLNNPIGNCMSITEIVDPNHLKQLARINDMWKSDKYLLSDAELNYKRNSIAHSIKL